MKPYSRWPRCGVGYQVPNFSWRTYNWIIWS